MKVVDEIKSVWKVEVERFIGVGKIKEGEIKVFIV